MSERDGLSYYLRQEEQARAQASKSDHLTARIAHLARADEYALRIAELKRQQPQ